MAGLKRFVFFLLILFVFFPKSSVQAATFTIAAGDVYGSNGLVWAINTANTNGETDTIILNSQIPYTLTTPDPNFSDPTGLPFIESEITILGNGATLERDINVSPFRILLVTPTGDLTVNDLTIRNGDTGGFSGAIHNFGHLTINNSTLTNNRASSGGAVDNQGGVLHINGSTFSHNTAPFWGGAISDGGTSTIANSTFSENQGDRGGAIATGNSMTISDSIFSNNTAGGLGGAIYNYSNLTIENTDFYNNSGKDGGAIDNNSGTLMITGGIYSGNHSVDWGGALSLDGTNILSEISLLDNSALRGGGLNTTGGSLVMDKVLVSSNEATDIGGGMYTLGTVTMTNSSIIDNTAMNGGAIFNSNNSVSVHTSCITGNTQTSFFTNSISSIDVINNWWGSADGPSGAGPGSGDSVSTNVTFIPYLTSIPPECPGITPPNQPPTVDAGGTYSVNEGSAVQVSSTGNDPDNGPLTYDWDLDNNGTYETSGQTVAFSAVGLDGPDTKTVAVRVTDDGGLTATDTTTVTVTNISPVVETITAPVASVEINTQVSTNASFTDDGTPDTHTAVWDWGDTTTSAGIVTETDGSGTVTGIHAYTTAGVYTVTLTVTDDDGGSGTSQYMYVVVYNPQGGFVTGAGRYNAPLGSIPANPTESGMTNFGVNAKYVNGVLTGSTRLNYRNGQFVFSFDSTSYDWLVVTNGNQAQLHGTGVVNGNGTYTFQLTALDDASDLIRIQVWDQGNTVIYDNGSSVLSNGNIEVHN